MEVGGGVVVGVGVVGGVAVGVVVGGVTPGKVSWYITLLNSLAGEKRQAILLALDPLRGWFW